MNSFLELAVLAHIPQMVVLKVGVLEVGSILFTPQGEAGSEVFPPQNGPFVGIFSLTRCVDVAQLASLRGNCSMTRCRFSVSWEESLMSSSWTRTYSNTDLIIFTLESSTLDVPTSRSIFH